MIFPGFPDDKLEAITASGELGNIGQAERLEILLSLECRQEKRRKHTKNVSLLKLSQYFTVTVRNKCWKKNFHFSDNL